MMADHADDGGDDDIFIYMGGLAPQHVTRVRIDKSVTVIDDSAFFGNHNLLEVETHDGIKIIGNRAFRGCTSLRGIKWPGVKIIEQYAFFNCTGLIDVEFGEELETIGFDAFNCCTSLRRITIPSVRTIEAYAFSYCTSLTDVDLPKDLETMGENAFLSCRSLRRIVIPLKDDMIGDDVFLDCEELQRVDLVGGVHKTIASLHLERWRNDMRGEIDRINEVLPTTYHSIYSADTFVRQWIETVLTTIEHYKTEHSNLLREATTLLELALWKAMLDNNENEDVDYVETTKAKKAKIDVKSERQELRITSGASIVIKNVLPFLELE